MSIRRIGIYAGAAVLIGLALWFFGGTAIDWVIASRLQEHQAKLEAVVQAKEQEIATAKQEIQTLTTDRDVRKAEAVAAAKEAERFRKERNAWMQQAEELAKRQHQVPTEVARVPDSQLGKEIRAALADMRAGIATACPIQ